MREIGRKGIIYGQKEHDYPDYDWKDFRKPRGFHDAPGWYKGKRYGIGKEPDAATRNQPPPPAPAKGWIEGVKGLFGF